MNETLLMLLFVLAMILPVFLGAIALSFVKKWDKNRVNPLTKSLRRPPGGRLSGQLVGLYFDLASSLWLMTLAVIFPVAIHLFQSHVLGKPDTLLRGIILGLLVVLGIGFFTRKLIRQFKQMKKYRMAYECELAVGQELDQLMRVGFQVFHDIPAENFNIDHLVVGPNGVIAVETKGRSKRAGTAGPGKVDYNVEYKNGVLRFPGWQETAPIEQAKLNAQWVSNWLSKATGFDVKAQGIVVLPGWFINTKSLNEIPVLAVGAIPKFLGVRNVQKLTEQQIKQIVYQVEQKTMDVKPGDSLRPIELSK